jgi:hypothetical protein
MGVETVSFRELRGGDGWTRVERSGNSTVALM